MLNFHKKSKLHLTGVADHPLTPQEQEWFIEQWDKAFPTEPFPTRIPEDAQQAMWLAHYPQVYDLLRQNEGYYRPRFGHFMNKQNLRKKATTYSAQLLSQMTQGLDRLSANFTADGAEAIVNFQGEGNEPQQYHIKITPITEGGRKTEDLSEGYSWGPEGPPPGIANASKLNMKKKAYTGIPPLEELPEEVAIDGEWLPGALQYFVENPELVQEFYDRAKMTKERQAEHSWGPPMINPKDILRIYELEYKRHLAEQYNDTENINIIESELIDSLHEIIPAILAFFGMAPQDAAHAAIKATAEDALNSNDIPQLLIAFNKVLSAAHGSGYIAEYALGAGAPFWLTYLSENKELPKKWERQYLYSNKLNMKKKALEIGGETFPDALKFPDVDTITNSTHKSMGEIYQEAESFVVNYVWSGLYERNILGPDNINVIQEDVDKLSFEPTSILIQQLIEDGWFKYLNQFASPQLKADPTLQQQVFDTIQAVIKEGTV